MSAFLLCICFNDDRVLLIDQDRTQYRPIWTSSEPANVKRVLPTISRWLQECEESHASLCAFQRGPEFPALPTRCIEVGESDGSIEPHLFISNGCHGRYTTLSHCWGKHLPFKSTESTLASVTAGIHFDALPKTYRDAISITRGLGIRYIWIDSLCIVQGEDHHTVFEDGC